MSRRHVGTVCAFCSHRGAACHLRAMPARSRVAPGATSTLLNGVLSFPLRSLSLSLSLSTLPLTLVLFLVGLGECPAIVDHGLGLFGLQRTGLAQDALKTSEAALRQQLRQANARLKVTQDAVERADQSRAIAERALNEALERCAVGCACSSFPVAPLDGVSRVPPLTLSLAGSVGWRTLAAAGTSPACGKPLGTLRSTQQLSFARQPWCAPRMCHTWLWSGSWWSPSCLHRYFSS